ncbi:hypothetical protein E8E13_011508 [Curvularia kusanoi]|uniref:Uncharacterized protein n=1 Tax=Curvularia kusanoi TaxID=90978 RepID=A0A9P4WCQ0_CURKU|nr:hypothetical protein E8E13_011508 [Curvularia kusanoi]
MFSALLLIALVSWVVATCIDLTTGKQGTEQLGPFELEGSPYPSPRVGRSIEVKMEMLGSFELEGDYPSAMVKVVEMAEVPRIVVQPATPRLEMR